MQTTGYLDTTHVTWRVLCSLSVLLAACGIVRAWTEICMHAHMTFAAHATQCRMEENFYSFASAAFNVSNIVLRSTKVLPWRGLLRIGCMRVGM